MGSQRPSDVNVNEFKIQIFKIPIFKFSNYTARLPFRSTKKIKLRQKTISYERYGEILFQKVASGYLLHFVQDGSSNNVLDSFLHNHIKSPTNMKTNTYIFPPNSRSTAPAAAMLLVLLRVFSILIPLRLLLPSLPPRLSPKPFQWACSPHATSAASAQGRLPQNVHFFKFSNVQNVKLSIVQNSKNSRCHGSASIWEH